MEEQTGKRILSRDSAWIAAIAAVAIAMYVPTFQSLWGKWMDDAQYSLAPLVPFVSGYFLWKKWPEVVKLKRSPSALGLALIAFAVVLHLVGVILDVSGPSDLSVFIGLLGGCLYFHSAQLVKVLAFPLAYTVFMIPLPGGILDRIGLPMQLMASGASASLLRLFGIDVIRSGIQLCVDGFNLEVAPGCSGMSSLVALMGVTAVFAYITTLPTRVKWGLFALSLPIAIVANVTRITSIAVVGYLWDWEKAISIYHDWSSPMLFLAAIIQLFIINWGLECLIARRNTS
jgi:exosortase